MNIAEQRQREAFEPIVHKTLQEAWSFRLDRPVSVASRGLAQDWLLSWPFGFFVVPSVNSVVRHFLRDSFRITPKLTRFVPQFFLGTMMSGPAGLRLGSKPGFSVDPPVPDAKWLAVWPCNQRVRIFDFRAGRVLVWLKSGFDDATMQRDISLRTHTKEPFILPVLSADAEGRWFEEEIFDGFTLARCPPWLRPKRALAMAIEQLDTWQRNQTPIWTSAQERAEQLGEALKTTATEVAKRFPNDTMPDSINVWIDQLIDLASPLGRVALVQTHGDFQPGNILVDRSGRTVRIIDWEHTKTRMALYDRLVLGLQSRWGSGMTARIHRFLAGDGLSIAIDDLPRDSAWRRSLVALFLLEDWLWYAQESLTGPYTRRSAGLELKEGTVGRWLSDMERNRSTVNIFLP